MHDGYWRGTAVSAFLMCCVGLGLNTSRAATPPVVPGVDRLRDMGKASPAQQGEVLLGELNCLACHSAAGQQRVLTKGAPDLSHAGARITPQYLRAYLSDPHHVKPGATMPDLFHASAPQAKQGAVESLTHYLVSLGGPVQPATIEGSSVLVEQGRRLYQTVGCVACHAPENLVDPKVPSVPLGNLAQKTTVDELAAFLLDPVKVRPGSRMPSSELTPTEATALAVYLLREQMDNPQTKSAAPARVAGIKYAYYEVRMDSADLSKFAGLRPKSEGTVNHISLDIPGRRHDDFALKFTGAISIPRDGRYTFSTNSDDGSRLYIDGKEIVNNDGVHPVSSRSGAIDLRAGDHPITVTYFQGGGGEELNVWWHGPQLKRQELPGSVLFAVGGRPMVPLESEKFVVDPQKAQMGKQMFASMGCAACHAIAGETNTRQAKALAALNLESADGCLSEHVAKGLPDYELGADQRAALKAALTNVAAFNTPLDAKQQVNQTLAAMNCYACHNRDGVGGPSAQRLPFFVMSAEFDMGDEGRLPPKLTGVGDKLQPDALKQIIFEGKLHIRPVLATRMPMFSQEKMPGLIAAFGVDIASGESQPPAFNANAAQAGRELVGTKGLGCVNCHGVHGIKSLGMPAPDLATAGARLRYPWFRRLLSDPNSVNPGTRMPPFWPGGAVVLKNIAGGTEQGQQDAIWDYVSLGKSMALPAGLQPLSELELVPTDQTIVHRTMMAGAGNRSILVGFPQQISVAFDADAVRMVEAWRGRFFDAKGMWVGRGGEHLAPLGTDILPMPNGPSFALLNSQSDPWPQIQPRERNVGGHFKGYVLDKDNRPTFHYVLNGVDIHEQPLPSLKPGGASLMRRFQLSAVKPPLGLYFLAAQGKSIESKTPGLWIIDGKQTLTIRSIAGGEAIDPVVRDVNGTKQLLVPVNFKNGKAAFDVEVSW